MNSLNCDTPAYSTNSGITVAYDSKLKTLCFSGWYDGAVGIEGTTFTSDEFFAKLGISQQDIERSFK